MSGRTRFELIYRRHAPAVKAYVLRRASASIADDVVADVFTVCWRRLEEVPADPLPWLIGVAARVLQTRWRSDSRRLRLLRRLEDAQRTALVAAPGTDHAIVGAALQRMRDVDRELLLLIAWEGLTPSQAATVLGIRPATVRVRLHRARNRLKLALAQPDERAGGPAELSMEASP